MNVLCRHTTQVSSLNVSSCHSHFSLGLAYSLAKRPDNAVEVCMYVCVLPYCVTINDCSNGIYCRNTRMLRMSWRREKVRFDAYGSSSHCTQPLYTSFREASATDRGWGQRTGEMSGGGEGVGGYTAWPWLKGSQCYNNVDLLDKNIKC